MHNWVIRLDYGSYIDYRCLKCGIEAFTLSQENHSNHYIYSVRNDLQQATNISCDEFIIKKIIE